MLHCNYKDVFHLTVPVIITNIYTIRFLSLSNSNKNKFLPVNHKVQIDNQVTFLFFFFVESYTKRLTKL